MNMHNDASNRPEIPALYSLRETAAALTISERGLRILIETGSLPTVSIGKRRMVAAEDLRSFIDQRRRIARPVAPAGLGDPRR